MTAPHGSRSLYLVSVGFLSLFVACERSPTLAEPSIGPILTAQIGAPGFHTHWISIGAGSFYSCALRQDGSAFCWGQNTFGQLGNGSQSPSSTPVPVSGGLTFTQMAVGDIHACGIDPGGVLYCWGANGSGQLGAGLPTGLSTAPAAVAGSLRFLTISAGLRTTCGISTGGNSYCWGMNQFGELGNGVVGVASTVPAEVVNSDALRFQVLRTGFQASCGSTAEFALHCWGSNLLGLFGNGPPTIPVTATFPTPVPAGNGLAFSTFDAGSRYICALDASQAAWCWGRNTTGELGLGTNTPSDIPRPVAGGLAFAFLDANASNNVLAHTCGVTPTDAAYCWGSNRAGQLGAVGASTCTFPQPAAPPLVFNCSLSPIAVGGNIGFRSIAVGNEHTCGVATDGAGYCWGANNSGQLGDGTLANRSQPTSVLDPVTTAAAVSTALTEIINELNALAASGEPESPKLADGAAKLGVAIHELAKEPPDNQAAAGNVEGAVGDLEAAVQNGLDPAEGALLMTNLANLVRLLATEAIAAAVAGGGDPDEIAEAQRFRADGDALRDTGSFKPAVNKYKDALAKAEGAP